MTPAPSASDAYVDLVAEGDWEHVADNMRDADRREVAALGSTPAKALKGSVALSQIAFTIRHGDEPVGLFGACTQGAVWMLGTPKIQTIRFRFLRQSRPWVNILHSASPVLWNWADARNDLHIRWLKWLGFRFHDERPYGVNGEPFRYFDRRYDDV